SRRRHTRSTRDWSSDVCSSDLTDCILDATDNFETRFLINDVAVKYKIPWIYGSAVGSYGLSMTVIPFETPCLRCVFESLPPPGRSEERRVGKESTAGCSAADGS